MEILDPILDAHAHAFPDAIANYAVTSLASGTQWMPVKPHHDGTVAGLVAQMDRAGIAKSIVCSIATKPAQTPKITDWSLSIASDRIIPFASIHPDYDKPEEEIARIAKLGIKGLKFHPQYQNCPIDDPRVVRIAKCAADHNLAMEFHCGQDLSYDLSDIAAPFRTLNLHKQVPGLKLMGCHLGGWRQWEESLELLAGEDIYLETSYCLGQCEDDLLGKIIEKHRKDRLVFGTDTPWSNTRAEIQKVEGLGLCENEKRLVLWENGARFSGMDGAITNPTCR